MVPSPKMARKLLGNRKATKNASDSSPAPNVQASKASRTKPVIRDSSVLDPFAGVMVDISPATRGDNSLGTNDGHGYAVNPATGQPYAPDTVNQGDFTRALAEKVKELV